ncbi:MAG: YkgJ family cysteine cluster protein, partial [Spirochaetales bacterium]|nr:YkgJ family cysteine cluster protein [Spirochaetales bacterium]
DPDLLFLHSLYADFDTKIERFSREKDIRCPYGCGRCCEEYEPEITPLEALYAAHWISAVKPILAVHFERLASREHCIFYNETDPLHCMIYPARPLLCRAFAYSGTLDKNGAAVYRSCRYMPEKRELREADIPLMTHAGREISFRQGSPQPRPVSEAVAEAWLKLQLALRYSNLDADGKPSGQEEEYRPSEEMSL